MKFETRFCTSADGTRIAYAVQPGVGRPLFRIHGWATVIDKQGENLFDVWRTDRTKVAYDRRGTGASTRDVEDISLDRQVEDVAAVVAALQTDTIDVFAYWDGTPVAIAFAAQHPDRIHRMSLYGPYIRGTDVISRDALHATMNLAHTNYLMLRRSMYTMGGGTPAEVERGMELMRQNISPDMAARSIELYGTMNVEGYVDLVSTPTLILYRPHDGAVTSSAVREVAARIPDSRLVTTMDPRPDRDELLHAFLDEQPLDPPSPEPIAPQQGTAIILFADIVDSTALTERMGDAAFRAKVRDLDIELRRVVAEAGGTNIGGKTLGDGVLATFSAASRAIDAALRCSATGADSGLPLHLGLHAGDVIREDGNVFGGAVNIASRISALSAPGEVLVSATVRDLARTSAEVRFEDRGEQMLKGVGDAVRMYVVRQAS